MYLAQFATRLLGRLPKRSTDSRSVKQIEARLAAEAAVLADARTTARLLDAYPASVARQAAVLAAMDAPTLTLPIIYDAEIVDPATMPLRRAELLAITDGRPAHELDFALAGAR